MDALLIKEVDIKKKLKDSKEVRYFNDIHKGFILKGSYKKCDGWNKKVCFIISD